MDSQPIYVFDKDGVLVDSEPLKLKALVELLGETYPDHVEEVYRYNVEHLGMARKDKLRLIFTEVIQVDDIEEKVEEYTESSYQVMRKVLANAPSIPGVVDYVKTRPNRRFLCSIALQEEVDDQLRSHDLEGVFEATYAFPNKKAEVLRRLKDESGCAVVFWGDTILDYNAASEAGVHFIGVETAKEKRPFADLDVPTIPDFSDHTAVEAIVAELVG